MKQGYRHTWYGKSKEYQWFSSRLFHYEGYLEKPFDYASEVEDVDYWLANSTLVVFFTSDKFLEDIRRRMNIVPKKLRQSFYDEELSKWWEIVQENNFAVRYSDKVPDIDIIVRQLSVANKPHNEPVPQMIIEGFVAITVYLKLREMIKDYEHPKDIEDQAYEYDLDKIASIYQFCIDDVFTEVPSHEFGRSVAQADFSAIYALNSTKKSKLKYIIYILAHIINNNDWYKQAAGSIGIEPKDCNGANISNEMWKKRADALK